MNKLFGMVFCITLCITAFAQTEADFMVELTQDGEGVRITWYTGSATTVIIPTTIQGMPVRELGDFGTWEMGVFEGKKNITSIIIPEGVTKIGNNFCKQSYQDDNKLVQITLPSTLQIIGNDAFSNNASLKSIIIPDGVTEIGNSAFSGCSSLESVTLPKSLIKLGSSAFVSTAISSISLPPNLTRIAGGTFWNCKNLTSIVFPEGLTEIGGSYEANGSGAFRDCIALTSVVFPSTVQKIGDSAFDGCSALTTITIPGTIEIIEMGYRSFAGCTRLTLASQAQLRRVGYTSGYGY